MIALNEYANEKHLSILRSLGDDANAVLLRGISKTTCYAKSATKASKSLKWSPRQRQQVLDDWKKKIKATKANTLKHIDDRPIKR